MFYKYLTNCTNEIIQEILIQLDQMMAKDPNTKKYLGPIKMEILNLVEENKNTLNQKNLSVTLQKEKTLPMHEILSLLKKLIQTGKAEQEQKNKPNQKIQP